MIKNLIAALKRLLGCKTSDIPKVQNINNIEQWSELEQDLLVKIQEHRDNLDLSLLIPSKSIREVAISRFEVLKLSPISHNGVGVVFKAIKDLGYQLPKEVLAYGYSTSESAFNALLKSTSHRKAIEEDNKYIGISIGKYNNRYYYILLFAR